MANIEYKSTEEQNRRTDFNPYKASMEEIEKDWIDLKDKLDYSISVLYYTIDQEYPNNLAAADKHAKRILDGAKHSSPFNEKLIYDERIKSIDEVKLEDFKYEKTFRACLESYYSILWYLDAMRADNEALIDKLVDLITNSTSGVKTIVNGIKDEVYEGKYADYTDYGILYQLIYDFSVNEIKIMIKDIERTRIKHMK